MDGNTILAIDECSDDNNGCTDAGACNYDPAATQQLVLDGALFFTWTSSGIPWSSREEIEWSISNASDDILFSGSWEDAVGSNVVLPAGEYNFNGFDSEGDGWNGHGLTITDDVSGNETDFTLLEGSSGSISVSVTGASSCIYPANEFVDCDNNSQCDGVLYEFRIADSFGDGTCCGGGYTISSDGDVLFTGDDFGFSANHAFCLPPGACVQVSFVADPYPNEQEWSLTADFVQVLGEGLDGSTATYSFCGFGCPVGDADSDGICDDFDDCVGAYDFCDECNGDNTSCGFGCMDQTACNYDASATEQLLVDGTLSFAWASLGEPYETYQEIAWNITNAAEDILAFGYAVDIQQEINVVLPAGEYNFNGFDFEGDGWNGFVMTITDDASGNETSFTLSEGSSSSISVSVTAASSCTYPPNDLVDCEGNAFCDEVLYEFNIEDSYGDGICCGGGYTISSDGEVLFTGDNFGSSANHVFCLPPEACVLVSFVTDPYPDEISWSLTADGALVLGEGLDGSTATYGTGGCVGGCTDPTACNYDDGSAADYDDGSCDLPAAGYDCEGNALCNDVLYEFNIEDSYGDGIFCEEGGGYTILSDGDVLFTGCDFGSSANHVFCLPPEACVQVSFVTDPYPDEISWSLTADGAPVLGEGLDGSTATYNTGGCVGGCTDPTACNYDDGSAADYDDGSCEGIAEGECDCEGNVLDALDECGGSCIEDSDSDGICDDVDLCIDTTACNYDANPTEACAMNDACGVCGGSGVDVDSDGICDDEDNCTDTNACNYEGGWFFFFFNNASCEYADTGYDCDGNCLNDTDDDGVCDEFEIAGCQDTTACNFNADATDDDGSCTYAEEAGYDCDGNCLNDADGDGVCDEFEVAGCTDVTACDYNADATDESSCAELDECGVCGGDGIAEGACDCEGNVLDAIGVCGGSCTADADADGICDDADDCVGAYDDCGVCNGPGAIYECGCADLFEGGFGEYSWLDLSSYASTAVQSSESQWNEPASNAVDGDLYTYNHTACGQEGDQWWQISLGGDREVTEVSITPRQDCCHERINGARVEVDGVLCADNLTLGEDINAPILAVCPTPLVGSVVRIVRPGASYACNVLHIAEVGIYASGIEEEAVCDCEGNGPEVGYDCDGNCLNDADDDGVCDEFEIAGCQDTMACNFNAGATDDDGSCTYAEAGYDCDGNCLNDADDDGVCDEFEIAGCQDTTACNFNADATDDDGSCTYAEAGYDCDGNCLNDMDDDGICDDEDNCSDINACNYEAWFIVSFVINESCEYPEAGYDCDGNCLNDEDDDGVCDEFEIAGCQDTTACNFNADATDDDGSCTYAAEAGYDCDGNCLNDADYDGVCDEFEITGCQDTTACNFNADATDDDGSCTYAEAGYDCDGNCLNDADDDGVCDEFEIAGCQDTAACNFNADATDDDGSCAELDECGVCGGSGIPEGNCDCAGNQNDACGICGGSGTDVDSDGICDDTDNCTDTSACNFDDTGNEVCSYPTTYYQDADGDGLGNASSTYNLCSDTPPSGYVEDSTDNCDNLLADNYNDGGNPECIFASGADYAALDSLLFCDGETVTLNLNTLHDGSGTGTWSYSLNNALDAFASAVINGNILTIYGMASGTGRDTLSISGAGNSEMADLSVIIQESTYPTVAGQYLVLPSNPASLDGGVQFTFEGHYDAPVSVHFLHHPTNTTDSDGSLILRSDVYWISAFTNDKGCTNPAPATSASPAESGNAKGLAIPYVLED
ncbi:MAG: discoidin domain-containing protein [Bacteroidota bacterium]|nr:discoidin domain-containing protein [Bacteroidota bacterium]